MTPRTQKIQSYLKVMQSRFSPVRCDVLDVNDTLSQGGLGGLV